MTTEVTAATDKSTQLPGGCMTSPVVMAPVGFNDAAKAGESE